MALENLQDATIGFIGLGKMGHPMALNVIKAGHEVIVYNRSKQKTQAHADAGGRVTESIAELSAASDIVITMISDDDALQWVALEDDVIANMQRADIFIDMSTVSPAASIKVGDATRQKNIAYLRSPVNGSVVQAADGILVILCSGPRASFDFIHPLFEIMGDRIFYLGEAEQARYLKLAINTMIGISSSMMGEALAFGEAGGLDWDTMIEVIASSAVGSPVVNYKAEALKNRDFLHLLSQPAKWRKTLTLPWTLPKIITSRCPLHLLYASIGAPRSALDGATEFFAYVEMLEDMAGLKIELGHTLANTPPTVLVIKVLAGAVYLPWYSDYLKKSALEHSASLKIGASSIL